MQKIKLLDREYEIPELSTNARELISSLKMLSELEKEKQKTLRALEASKMSYVGELKKEILAAKAGLVL
jgi:hypothetical protein